jgi:hypothetical protein
MFLSQHQKERAKEDKIQQITASNDKDFCEISHDSHIFCRNQQTGSSGFTAERARENFKGRYFFLVT